MKNCNSFFKSATLALSLLTGCEPNEILPIEKTASINFSAPSGILEENNHDGITVRLTLSRDALENGEASIQQINRGDFNPFITEPAISPTGLIKLKVEKGKTETILKFTPIKDGNLTGHTSFTFQITDLSPNLHKGSNEIFELLFIDQELSGKLKAFETEGQAGYYKQEFSYNTTGKLDQVQWTNSKNQTQMGKHSYKYNEFGELVQIHATPENHSQMLTYENGLLIKNERPSLSEKFEFEVYNYDSNGNLQSITYKIKFASGAEGIVGYRIFSYFPSGNAESIEHYLFTSPVETVMQEKIQYSEYTLYDNPLPNFNNIPGLLYQPKMPGKIVYHQHGQTNTYKLDYEVDGNSRALQRTLHGPGGIEETRYYYH